MTVRIMRRPDRAKGFTLHELLVVSAILALLLVLALQVTSSIRQRSRSVQCIQNLRELGVALLAYTGDHGGNLPPRSLGLYRGEDESKPPLIERPWPNRLLLLGYATKADIFYCPAFPPTSNQRAAAPLPSEGKLQTYGLRTWVAPGHLNWKTNKTREEHKPLSAISEPGDFFLVADSLWIHPAYRSQGYGIAPGMHEEQFVHLRHNRHANVLFADGHVEAKPRAYFEELPERQRAYSASQALPFGISEVTELDAL